MNTRLLAKHLSTVCLLIGATMVFSLPWALPQLGHRTDERMPAGFEADGFRALLLSMVICAGVGAALGAVGRRAKGKLYRKEAMAVVGLSWILATVMGGMPFYLSDTYRSPSLRLYGENEPVQLYAFQRLSWTRWLTKEGIPKDVLRILALPEDDSGDERTVGIPKEVLEILALLQENGARGVSADGFLPKHPNAEQALQKLATHPDWQDVLLVPGDPGPQDRRGNYRVRWVRMSLIDSLFESQSGFSTTGATVLSDVEDPQLVSHCILFWRSSTHFLGGLGIIVLFVVILGQGSAGKAMMRAEMPGPSKDGAQSRMQHTAWLFALTYVALNLVLTLLLKLTGLTWFDSLCHAFGTMATGGFSTYNASVGHFDRAVIDFLIILFMGLAGTNFMLLFSVFMFQPQRLFADVEWRTYVSLIVIVTLLVMGFGLAYGDFLRSPNDGKTTELFHAVRFGLFQVISILTTTGYGTHDFDAWNSFGRGVLFLLMFVGGCAGSTGGGMKVIRHVLFFKIIKLEIEQAFHPTVVRPLRLGGKPVEDPDLRKNILVYFCMILLIFVLSWLFIITVEPDATWGNDSQHKLLDSASAVAAMVNNIGPGLGTVGATQNYGHFSAIAKFHFTWLMMLGRVEVFAIVVLFVPTFWRSR